MKCKELLIFCALMSGILAGCSLRYDFTECEVNADCERVETDQFLQCVDNACVEATGLECRSDDDCAGGESCVAGACEAESGGDGGMNDMSMVDGGEDSGSADAGVDMNNGCTATSQCGTDEICLDEMCTSVLSEQCGRAVFPSGSLDNPVVVGSILPLSPPYTNIGPPLEQAVELAMADFNREGGLPGGRKVVWVSCDDRGSSDLAQDAAQHLVDLGSPAIIGPLFSTAFIDVTTNVTARNGVYTIAPTASAPSLTGLDDNGLAWRAIASDVYQGNAIVDRVEILGVDKATVFVKDDAYGLGLFNEVATPLNNAFSGMGQQVEFVQYADPATFGFDQNQITAEFAMKVSQAYSDNPDAELVVFVGTSETLLLANAYLQFLGQNGVPPANYPRLLFSHGSVPDLPDLVAGSGGSLLPLVEGTAPDIFDADNFQEYTLRFNLRFDGEDPVTVSTLTYDSTFVVLFGMSAVPQGEEITGDKIAANMAKLVDKDNGTPISFGDSIQMFISNGRNTLASGGTVDLKGVSGELDFDLATGDVRSNVLGWEVVDSDGNGNYQLDAQRVYLLDPEPATTGTWMDLM